MWGKEGGKTYGSSTQTCLNTYTLSIYIRRLSWASTIIGEYVHTKATVNRSPTQSYAIYLNNDESLPVSIVTIVFPSSTSPLITLRKSLMMIQVPLSIATTTVEASGVAWTVLEPSQLS